MVPHGDLSGGLTRDLRADVSEQLYEIRQMLMKVGKETPEGDDHVRCIYK